MPPEPVSWIASLLDEFDRYSETLIAPDGTRYRCPITNKTISSGEREQIRDEVIANATADRDSLAFHILALATYPPPARSHRAPCDIAVRLGWGASATRRALGLPASDDFDPPS